VIATNLWVAFCRDRAWCGWDLVEPGDVKTACQVWTIEMDFRPDRGRDLGQASGVSATQNSAGQRRYSQYENYSSRSSPRATQQKQTRWDEVL